MAGYDSITNILSEEEDFVCEMCGENPNTVKPLLMNTRPL